jgi:hypothetical protein
MMMIISSRLPVRLGKLAVAAETTLHPSSAKELRASSTFSGSNFPP